MSPISFFFGPFPKLLLRDHEKKMPRFLSALSSRLSSFSDLPDLCFLASCWLKNKKQRLNLLCQTNEKCQQCLASMKSPFSAVKKQQWNLFRSGKCRAVRAGAVFWGRWTAGDLVGVRQGSAVHLSTHALLVKGGLEEAWVTVKLHQVEDLRTWRKKSGVWVNKQQKAGERRGVSESDGRIKRQGWSAWEKKLRWWEWLNDTAGHRGEETTSANIWLQLMLWQVSKQLTIYHVPAENIHISDYTSMCLCVQYALDPLWVYASLCLCLW